MTKHKQTQKIAFASTAVALGLAGIVGMTVPTHAEGSEVKIDVNVKDAISLAVYPYGDHTTESNQLSFGDVMPGGELVRKSLDVVVKTNVGVGYQLTMRDADNNTGLAQIDGDGVIPTLESPTKASEFPTDRWGYIVGDYNDGMNFSGIPAYSTTPALIAKSNANLPNEGETTSVTFGTKISPSLDPGVYEDTVMFTASAELIPDSATQGMTEWTTGLYWDTSDLEGTYTWQEANEACMKLGKRLPSIDEYEDLLVQQNIAKDQAGINKITKAPYNFKDNQQYLTTTLAGENVAGTPLYEADWGYRSNNFMIESATGTISTFSESVQNGNMAVRCVLDK